MRVVNRLLALLIGVLLAVAGGLLVAEIVAVLVGRPPLVVGEDRVGQLVAETQWTTPVVVVILAATGVVGLVLLLAQLWPRAPTTLALRDRPPQRAADVDRRGLQDVLRQQAMEDTDVLAARVRWRGRRRLRVMTQVPPDASLREVRQRVAARMRDTTDALGLRRRPRPTVKVRHARRRVR